MAGDAARRRPRALSRAEDSSEAPDFKGVPDVFVELLGFPYVFGPQFLEAVIAKEGGPGRNRVFTERPTTEEHILQPETYFARQRALPVGVPAVVAGEEVIEGSEGDIGMLSLLVVLAERIDFGVAWPAVQGWAGDAVVAFERGGKVCVRGDVAFDEAAQAERFGRALDQWAAGRPATRTRADRSVVFEACDPGVAAEGRKSDHVSGIEGLRLRQGIITGVQSEGLSPKVATCVVDGLLEKLTADRVASLDRTPQGQRNPLLLEVQRTVAQLVPGCR